MQGALAGGTRIIRELSKTAKQGMQLALNFLETASTAWVAMTVAWASFLRLRKSLKEIVGGGQVLQIDQWHDSSPYISPLGISTSIGMGTTKAPPHSLM